MCSFFLVSACDKTSHSASLLSKNPNRGSADASFSPSLANATPSSTTAGLPTPSIPVSNSQISCGSKALTFKVIRTIQRSALGLTEGLIFVDGKLFESTGSISGHGPSVLNALDPASGKVSQLFTTPDQSFGEGLVKLGAYFFQLTYTEEKIYKYVSDGTSAGTRLIGTYESPVTEGWGLTTDGTDLIASNGSSTIYRIDPSTLKLKSQFQVLSPTGNPVSGMNELEYVNGQVYANLFPTDRMIRFDAVTGCQTAEIDLSPLPTNFNCSLYRPACTNDSVANGVAFDPFTQLFYLTGKSWPVIFEGNFE